MVDGVLDGCADWLWFDCGLLRYLYKSALLGSQAGNGAGDAANPLNMWPPLVMPLHLGAFENALREREQALALYGITQQHARDKAAAEAGDQSSTFDL